MKHFSQGSNRWWLLAVMTVALLVRGGFLLSHHEHLHDDEDGYQNVAEILRQTGTLGYGLTVEASRLSPSAHRPPLYPMMLAAVASQEGGLSVTRVGLLNLGLGLATVFCVWILGREIAPDRPLVAAIAALTVTADPLLLERTSHTLTETPAAFFAALFAWLTVRAARTQSSWEWGFAGLSLGLGALCRPTFLPALVLTALALVFLGWLRRNEGGFFFRQETRFAGAAVLGGICVLAPWAIRNYLVFGVPLLTTTHGGHTLVLSNDPAYLSHVRDWGAGADWEFTGTNKWLVATDPLFAGLDPDGPGYASLSPEVELAMDRRASEIGWNFIRKDVEGFCQLLFARQSQFWKLMPGPIHKNETHSQWLMRCAVGAWYGLILVGALGMFFAKRGSWLSNRLWWGLILVIAFVGVHAFYWTSMRMRAPLMPWLCVLSASGTVAAADWVRELMSVNGKEIWYARKQLAEFVQSFRFIGFL